MGRLAPHARALGLRGVAGAHHRAKGDIRQLQQREFFANALEGRIQIALNVVRQGLQRRHIDDAGLIRQAAIESLLDQLIYCREEGSKCFTGTGGGGDQHMLTSAQGRPGALLRGGRRIKSPRKPSGNSGME